MSTKMDELTMRVYDPTNEDDVAACVALSNAMWPDELMTTDEWKHRDKSRDPNIYFESYLFELDGNLVADGAVFDSWWMQDSVGHLDIRCHIHPDHEAYLDAVYAVLVEKAVTQGAKTLHDDSREDKVAHIAALKTAGFKEVLRNPMSELVVEGFDFAPYAGLLPKLTSKGFKIWTMRELMSCDDPNWMRKVYDMECDILKDVPSPEPFQPFAFELYEQRKLKRPSFNGDAWLVAVDTSTTGPHDIGTMAAMSNVSVPPAQPQRLQTGLTGVRHDYRRLGLATALKVEVIRWAVAQQAESIVTDNEENNPMYAINMKLGFRPKPAFLDFTLEIRD